MPRQTVICSFYCLLLIVLCPHLGVADAADAPSSQPATPDASLVKALANGTVRFTAPDGWEEAPATATDLRAAFFLPDHASVVSVEVLPADATIGPESFGAIMRSLRQTRQQRREKFVEGPTNEKDNRFLLRIHEKYRTMVKVDDKPAEKTASQLHLYRQVGPRIIMVTVWSTADADEELKQAQAAGEEMALSAVFGRPSRKKKD